MTTIIEDVKLDFQDVLLMPKRSNLSSRSNVSLEREMKFKHSTCTYRGIPIIAANMDSVGTINMAQTFFPHGMSVALHKFYSVDKIVEFYKQPTSGRTFYTIGTLG
jgi:GMP reductase